MIQIAYATAALTLAFAGVLAACYGLLAPLSRTEVVRSWLSFCMGFIVMASFALGALWMGVKDQERENFQRNLDRMSRALTLTPPQAKPPKAIERSI